MGLGQFLQLKSYIYAGMPVDAWNGFNFQILVFTLKYLKMQWQF